MSVEIFRCGACGRSGVRRSEHQRFCSDNCRAYAEAQKPLSAEGGHSDSPSPPPTHQRSFKSISRKNGSKFRKEISGLKLPILGLGAVPLNLLGGYRWPGAGALDRGTVRKVLRAEVAEAPASEGCL
jgi:hypothetical protein